MLDQIQLPFGWIMLDQAIDGPTLWMLGSFTVIVSFPSEPVVGQIKNHIVEIVTSMFIPPSNETRVNVNGVANEEGEGPPTSFDLRYICKDLRVGAKVNVLARSSRL